MSTIVVVDYGMGNVASVVNAFARLGVDAKVTSEPRSVAEADALVLPGVGAFAAAAENLRRRGLDEALTECARVRQRPFLGICLGMQLLAEDSTESGHARGLGWLEGHVIRLQAQAGVRVPHVGWNELDVSSSSSLLQVLPPGSHVYFDHSYHLVCAPSITAARARHGAPIVAAVERENLFATQFHPEKSQRAGLRVLRAFASWVAGGRC